MGIYNIKNVASYKYMRKIMLLSWLLYLVNVTLTLSSCIRIMFVVYYQFHKIPFEFQENQVFSDGLVVFLYSLFG